MQKGTLFIAPPGAKSKKEHLFAEIVSLHPGTDYSSVLYLAPNNSVVSDARDRFFSFLAGQHNRSAYVPFQALTIRQLAGRLYENSGRGQVITERTRVLILCRLLKERNIGFATILADLSKKIRHYLPDHDLMQVKDRVQTLMVEEKAAMRAVRAFDILEEYYAELKRKNLIDAEGILQESIQFMRTDTGQYTTDNVGCSTLVIDGFFDPTPLELKIIKTLINNADHVYVMAEERTGIITFLQSYKKDMLVRRLDRTVHRDKTGYYVYPSMEEEVEGIARNIRKCMIEGMNPWEITVCFPVLSTYLPMLRRIFRKFSIPVSLGEYSLSSSRPFAALEEMITCLEGDYSRSNFLSFLTSPHFPGIPAVVKERSVSLSYRAGVVKGKSSWLAIRETLLNSPKDEISEDNRELLDEFQQGIKGIIDVIEDIKRQNGPVHFIDALESALVRFGFFDSLYAEADTHGDMISDRVNSQLSEFRRFAGMYEDSGQGIDNPLFYVRYLLSNLKSSEENRDGVKVLPFELAAGVETGVLFFGGMREGDFPSRPGIDPILPERIKKELGMPYLEYYLNRQKQYFRRLLHVSSRDPFISFPSADSDKIFLPSPFLEWENSLIPPELNIFSEEDVLLREGAVRLSAADTGIFHDGTMFRSTQERRVLLKRIGQISKGFFSVTDIDFYRKCPLRFYIERVLGLEAATPPRFEVEARLWGSLAHSVLEHLFRDGDVEPEMMEERILQGLEKGLKRFPLETFWQRVAREIFHRLLPALKEQEHEIRMQGYSPFRVEEKLKAEIDGLKLKGKVDRIDCRPSASGKRKTAALLDYKTGNADSRSLQLPLYAAMWRKNYSEPVERLGYYSLKEGKVSWYPGKKTTMDEFIQSALEDTKILIGQIMKAEFPPDPFRADECRYCHHGPVCSGII